MPKNAKYTSPEIQNEVIQILASMVKETIVTDCLESDIGLFCLKCDETRDRCNVENMSVVLRFVKQGLVQERLLSVINLEEVDANGITKAILKELRDNSIDPSNILSQCFDGAAVMNGAKGAVQKLLQHELQKVIPYVHCYNHQLHLVVVHSMEAEPKAKSFFAICQQLYIFLRRHYASTIYEGQSLKRLLEQRWTGHLDFSVVIKQNRDEIIETLEILAESRKVPADVNVEAQGLFGKVKKPQFALMAEIVVKLLTVMKPANAMLQSKTCNMGIASELVQSVIATYKELRSDDTFAVFAEAAGLQKEDAAGPKRATVQSKLFKDSVVMTSLGQSGSRSKITGESLWNSEKRAYFHILDGLVGELETRFGVESQKLHQALSALMPSSASKFLAKNDILYLAELMRLDASILDGELLPASKFIMGKLDSSSSLADATTVVHTYREAFPNVYALYAGATTIGISTATCENSFSALTRVLRPSRQSMTHERKAALVQLAFEKSLTRNIDLDEFVAKFASSSRRILL